MSRELTTRIVTHVADQGISKYEHRVFNVGHNVPQEAPRAFAQAVIDAGHL